MNKLRRFRNRLTGRYTQSPVFQDSLSAQSSPPRRDDRLPLVPSVEDFARLEPVHAQILEALSILHPSLVVSLSKRLYNRYVPTIYKEVTLNDRSFDGLFRSYSRGLMYDNDTIRAYKHTRTLRIFEVMSGHHLSTVTCGDQPMYLPHVGLFENAARLEISWEVFMLQADEDLYYMYVNIASHAATQLNTESLQELVINYKQNSDRTAINKALDGWVKECKPKTVTFIIDANTLRMDENVKDAEIPELPVDQEDTKLLRFVIAPPPTPDAGHELSSRSIKQAIHRYIVRLASETGALQNQRRNHELKLEFHTRDAQGFKNEEIGMLARDKRNDAISWMGQFAEFCELEEKSLALGWSDLWAEAKGQKVIKTGRV